MIHKNHEVYDDSTFFERYKEGRHRQNSPNKTLERPIIEELVGLVNGKTILDLGCGDGKYGLDLLGKGALHYYGVDGSANMTKLATENLKGKKAIVERQDISSFSFQKGHFDLVVSRLVLHYIEDLAYLLDKIKNTLKPSGRFVCSVEHPVLTSCNDSYKPNARRGNWLVDNYFSSGKRVNNWKGKQVVKYHRTVEDYFLLFQKAGFEIEAIRESKPVRANFETEAEFERRGRIPLFMLFGLSKG